MKRLLIGILITSLYLYIFWSMWDTYEQGKKFRAARINAIEQRNLEIGRIK